MLNALFDFCGKVAKTKLECPSLSLSAISTIQLAFLTDDKLGKLTQGIKSLLDLIEGELDVRGVPK